MEGLGPDMSGLLEDDTLSSASDSPHSPGGHTRFLRKASGHLRGMLSARSLSASHSPSASPKTRSRSHSRGSPSVSPSSSPSHSTESSPAITARSRSSSIDQVPPAHLKSGRPSDERLQQQELSVGVGSTLMSRFLEDKGLRKY